MTLLTNQCEKRRHQDRSWMSFFFFSKLTHIILSCFFLFSACFSAGAKASPSLDMISWEKRSPGSCSWCGFVLIGLQWIGLD